MFGPSFIEHLMEPIQCLGFRLWGQGDECSNSIWEEELDVEQEVLR